MSSKVQFSPEYSKFGTASYQQAIAVLNADYFVDVLQHTAEGIIIKDFRPIWEAQERLKENSSADSSPYKNKQYRFTPFWIVPHAQFELFLDLNNLICTGQEYLEFVEDAQRELLVAGLIAEFIIADSCDFQSTGLPMFAKPIDYTE